MGIRTPVLALKGLRPGPLDDRGLSCWILSFETETVKVFLFICFLLSFD